MIRRLLGMLMLLVGLSGVGASYVGARMGHLAVEKIAAELVDALDLMTQSLNTIGDSLLLAKGTVAEVSRGLDTVEAAAGDLAGSLDETQPMLDQIGTIVSKDMPDSIELMQAAFPAMAQVAGVIDDTLTTLNSFRIDQRILGFDIKYDLGIDYDPEVPFDESVLLIGRSLDGIPEKLRSLQEQVETTSGNLDVVGQDIDDIISNLKDINAQISATDPMLDNYTRIVTDLNDRSRLVRAKISEQVEDAKDVVTFLMVWIAVSQMAPIYLGWDLALGRRPR